MDISKDAFLKAGNGELNNRRDAQREMLFDGIMGIANKLDNFEKTCENKFASKKDVTWITWGLRFIFGFIVAILGYLKIYGN